jgi:hypothetical protein
LSLYCGDVFKGGAKPFQICTASDSVSALGTAAEERAIVEGQNKAGIVADGLVLGESPRWRDRMLWVSDWAAIDLLRFDAAGRREVVARVASFPMCIDHLTDGRLSIVDSAGKRLLRREQDGTLAQHADIRQLSGLDGFGADIVVDRRARFTSTTSASLASVGIRLESRPTRRDRLVEEIRTGERNDTVWPRRRQGGRGRIPAANQPPDDRRASVVFILLLQQAWGAQIVNVQKESPEWLDQIRVNRPLALYAPVGA